MKIWDPDLKPWSFQIEPVEGCNRRCKFCAINSIRKPGDTRLKLMGTDLLESICLQINAWRPNARIEVNLHGEPSLHPFFFELLKLIRLRAPHLSIMVQTNLHVAFANGDPYKWLRKCFDSGANMISGNCYTLKFYEQMTHDREAGTLARGVGTDVKTVDFYFDNPEHLSMYHNHGPKARILFVLYPLDMVNEKTGIPTSKYLTNHAGGVVNVTNRATQHVLPLKKYCTRVYREMVVDWKGRVQVCCYDWLNCLPMGNARETPIREIWHSRLWHEVRGLLNRKNPRREMVPCNRCDYTGGFRPGLTPMVEPSPDALEYVLSSQKQP